jgi:hypothetical protein
VSERFEFIDVEKATVNEDGQARYRITSMCEWLEVSTSGYYEWCGRLASATAERREWLKLLIVKIFDESDGTYGYRRVHAEMVRGGEQASPELVRRLMRELGLVPCQPRPWRVSLTEQDTEPAAIPDLVGRDFTAECPGTKLVGDITYIPTWKGWLFLATVIDCCTKEIVGYAMDDNYKTPLVEEAIFMAARNQLVEPDAIFHSDRGSNYTSAAFAATLDSLGIRQSVGRTGICFDNPWPNRSSVRCRTSGSTKPCIRHESMPAEILHGTSSSATIPNGCTRALGIRPHAKPDKNTLTSGKRPNKPTKQLSGKRGAAHRESTCSGRVNATSTATPAPKEEPTG